MTGKWDLPTGPRQSWRCVRHLRACRSFCCRFTIKPQQLKNGLQVLFDSADETLFEMADKARSDVEQSLFFEAMRDVRLKRKYIERGFLDRFLTPSVSWRSPTPASARCRVQPPQAGLLR